MWAARATADNKGFDIKRTASLLRELGGYVHSATEIFSLSNFFGSRHCVVGLTKTELLCLARLTLSVGCVVLDHDDSPEMASRFFCPGCRHVRIRDIRGVTHNLCADRSSKFG
jgi:hypothetical protein